MRQFAYVCVCVETKPSKENKDIQCNLQNIIYTHM